MSTAPEADTIIMKWLAGLVGAVGIVGGVSAILAARSAPSFQAVREPPPAATAPLPSNSSNARLEWSPAVLVPEAGDGGGATPSSGSLSGRFRLAGIFIIGPVDAETEGVLRRAILDDVSAHAQLIVGEGELLAGARVVRIGDDFVRLLDAAGQTTDLRLAYQSGAAADGSATASASGEEEEGPPLEVTKFGRKVQENRWVLEREAMLDYYREMTADPDRIARLYETFKPDYGENGEIRGYEIDPLGEEEFLQAMGLRAGDRLRMVNSLRMSSQSRAEFFVKEFVNERLGAVVIDLEREGQPVKQVYLFR